MENERKMNGKERKMEGTESKMNGNERKMNGNERKMNRMFSYEFLRDTTSKSTFRARFPSIFITCHKMPRLRRNLHLGTTLRSADNAIRKKTRNMKLRDDAKAISHSRDKAISVLGRKSRKTQKTPPRAFPLGRELTS